VLNLNTDEDGPYAENLSSKARAFSQQLNDLSRKGYTSFRTSYTKKGTVYFS